VARPRQPTITRHLSMPRRLRAKPLVRTGGEPSLFAFRTAYGPFTAIATAGPSRRGMQSRLPESRVPHAIISLNGDLPLSRGGRRLRPKSGDRNVTSVAPTLKALYWKECFKVFCSV